MPRVADPKAKISLLRAAEAVFAERGLATAKVEDIAKRAGLSKGAFYLHFESKEGALKHVVESFLARCGSCITGPEEVPDLPDDAAGLLDLWFERDLQIFEFLWQSRAILRILSSCQGDYRYLVETFRSDIDRRTRSWVEAIRRIGLFRSVVDPTLAAALMGGAYHELTVRMVQANKRPPLEAWLRFAQDTFARAYGTPALIAVVGERDQRVTLERGEA